MDRVDDALAAVPREGFLPPAERARAGDDAPVLIGHGQTNSQPRTVAAMLRLLDVRPGQRVLDVGAGSGWTTALLAHLAGPAGHVTGTELVPDLAAAARLAVAAAGADHAEVLAADPDVLGHPTGGPYDRILVSAGAPRLPEPLVAQLGDRGRLVVPVASVMTVVEVDAGEQRVSEHGWYRFVPLLWPGFEGR